MAISLYCYGETKITLHTLLVSVSDTIDKGTVSRDGDFTCALSRVPYPLTCVLLALGQTRNQREFCSFGHSPVVDCSGLVGVGKPSQFVVVDGFGSFLDLWREFCWWIGIDIFTLGLGLTEGVHQDGVTQVVVTTTCGTLTTTVNAHIIKTFLRERHLHALHSFIDSSDCSPIGTYLSTQGWFGHQP